MDNFNYLVAIAMIEQDNNRLMPIGGKASKEEIDLNLSPSSKGENISLELCLRILQLSFDSPIKLLGGEKSILLIEIPMKEMQEKLPVYKAEWLSSGDSEKLILNISEISNHIWFTKFIKYEGVKFEYFDKEKLI